MSSGNNGYKGRMFNISGKPNDTVAEACEKSQGEPRGPQVKNSALCCTCGTLTIHRDGEGLPRHKRKAA